MSNMSFGRWTPLSGASADAPSSAGVFQIKIPDGLIDYPRGKSAMIHYQVAADLQQEIAAFASKHPTADWRCRHIEAPLELSKALLEQILEAFVARFGMAPTIPENPTS